MNLSNLQSQISKAKTVQIVFRLGAFAVLAAVIVLLFPRYNNAFRYHFEVGKPWGYTTLTADFDFPIYKTDEQLEKEQQAIGTPDEAIAADFRDAALDTPKEARQRIEFAPFEGRPEEKDDDYDELL